MKQTSAHYVRRRLVRIVLRELLYQLKRLLRRAYRLNRRKQYRRQR